MSLLYHLLQHHRRYIVLGSVMLQPRGWCKAHHRQQNVVVGEAQYLPKKVVLVKPNHKEKLYQRIQLRAKKDRLNLLNTTKMFKQYRRGEESMSA